MENIVFFFMTLPYQDIYKRILNFDNNIKDNK